MRPDISYSFFQDGGLAWDAKDFLIEQDGCEEVVIEQKTYKGKFPKRSSGSPVENWDHKKVNKREKRAE